MFAEPTSTYILVLTAAGALIALVAWLPLALRRLPLSLPIVCIAIGAAIFSLPQVTLRPSPLTFPTFTERFTEFVVIVALMGAGLKLDRVFSFRRWRVTWRLLVIAMPISILGIALVGGWLLNLPVALALLLGATLAPTDPVLASDVQVGPPRTGEEDEVRFGLTSEAGLNDGLAFPFVNLALALAAAAASSGGNWLGDWLLEDVVWKLGMGVAGGWLVGRMVGWLTFHMPVESKLAQTGDGFIAVAATFLAYGLTEVVHGYGFLAVFVAALTIRHAHRDHDFHHDMHDLTEQVERLATMVLLLLFGGALVNGLLAPLGAIDVVAAVLVLLVVRPVAGLASLIGFRAERTEKLTLAFFGIRGVGSFYYLAYALNHADLPGGGRLWAFVGLVVLLSILLHGLTVTPVMRGLDRSQGRDPDADPADEQPASASA